MLKQPLSPERLLGWLFRFSSASIVFFISMGIGACGTSTICTSSLNGTTYMSVSRCTSLFNSNEHVCSTSATIILSVTSFVGGIGGVVAMGLIYSAFWPLFSSHKNQTRETYKRPPWWVYIIFFIAITALFIYYYVFFFAISTNVLFAALFLVGAFIGLMGGGEYFIIEEGRVAQA